MSIVARVMLRLGLGAVIGAAIVIFAPAAHADDRAAAETAFLHGKELFRAGQTAEACAAFALSQRLDPQFGTQYNLAICYEELGKTASAWVLYRELAQRDGNASRKQDCAQRAQRLEPLLNKLLITMRDPVPGLHVTRSGVDVTHLIGVEDAVDPGRYRIVASADGYRDVVRSVVVSPDSDAIAIEIPPLEWAGGAGAAPIPARTIAGLSTAGAGAIVLGVGLGFGLSARSKWSEVESLCGTDLACENKADRDRASDLTDDSRRAATVSTVLVGVGAAAIVTGVVLWLTAPDRHDERERAAVRFAPHVGPTGAGIVATGVF